MNCQACIQECKDWGGWCAPVTQETLEVAKEIDENAHTIARKHRRTAHTMTLHGALWKCGKGHEAEATPQDTMRAAGVPMLL